MFSEHAGQEKYREPEQQVLHLIYFPIIQLSVRWQRVSGVQK